MVDIQRVLLSPLTPIIIVCAVLARAIHRGWWSPRWPFYRPISWLLAWWVTFSSGRAALQHFILRPARETLGGAPYPWPVRAAWLADLALDISWPFAILGACLVVFMRRRTWPAAVAWLACCVALAVAYPALRQRPLLLVEAGISTACLVACAWTVWRNFTSRAEVWLAHHLSLVPILGAQAGVMVSVAWWDDPVRDWPIARLVQGVAYVLLLAHQVRQIRKYRVRAR